MRFIPFAILLAILLGITSCGGHSAHVKEQISLNDGERWKVHDNMMIHISQMSDDIRAASTDEAPDMDALHKKLKGGLKALTSDCTMEGQAHDELHKWLVPFMNTVNGYDPQLGSEQKKLWLIKLQESVNEFSTYFK